MRVLFLIPARGEEGLCVGGDSTAIAGVLFLIPAGWEGVTEGVLRVCGGCEMMSYCDVGIIFNTRVRVGRA